MSGKPDGIPERPHGPPARPLWDRIETIVLAADDLTLSQVAERSGLPRSTIYRLKTAVNRPHRRTVQALASALGIDQDVALELAGYPRSAPLTRSTSDLLAAAEELASEVEEEIHRRVAALSYRQQIEVLRFMRELVGVKSGDGSRTGDRR